MEPIDLPYEMHGTGTAAQAIFTFGSYVNPNRSAPSYAFMKTCLDMQNRYKPNCDIYYFVAKANDWYFSGVRGLGDNFQEAVAGLSHLRQRYKRTVFVGNSMGGYAALAFGFLAEADQVVAFSPQTRLDAVFQESIGEKRWKEAISSVQTSYDCEPFAVDTIIRKIQSPQTRAKIFVGQDCTQDVAYAQAVRFSPAVEVNLIPGQGHDLVHTLRETGDLIRIIHETLA